MCSVGKKKNCLAEGQDATPGSHYQVSTTTFQTQSPPSTHYNPREQQDCQALSSAISFCIFSLNYTAFCFMSLSHCEFMFNLMLSVPLQSNTIHKTQYYWTIVWQEIYLASLWILDLIFSKFTWEVLTYNHGSSIFRRNKGLPCKLNI